MGSKGRKHTSTTKKTTAACSSMTSVIESDVISTDSKGRKHTSTTKKTTVVPASSCVSTTPAPTKKSAVKPSKKSTTSCSSMTSVIETDVVSTDSKGRKHTSTTKKTT